MVEKIDKCFTTGQISDDKCSTVETDKMTDDQQMLGEGDA